LALIAAAQRVEHYEIAAYGTVKALARQIGAIDAARLLSHTLGEEQSSDFLLTAISDPLLQQAAIEDGGNNINLEAVTVGRQGPTRATKKAEKPEKIASQAR
jgi:Mn-containing catalase